MKTTKAQFIDTLATALPEIRAILREHLEDQFGELLPHVFMGDLTRWLLGMFVSAGPEDLRVKTTLGLMERGLDSSEPVRELITASFLENLPLPGEPQSAIRELLGPRLKKQLRKMG